MPEEVADDRAHCVGSIEGWLLVARPTNSQSCEDDDNAENERFLVNAFSRDLIHLPRLRTPYCSTFGEASWISDDRDHKISRSLQHVVISASPDSGTKCILAGFSYRRTMPGFAEWRYIPGLTLWRPGMKEWYVYQCDSIDWLSNLVFYQGKLYMLHRTNPWLTAVTLGEDENGVNVAHVEHCVAEDEQLPDHHHPPYWIPRSNVVVWRDRLIVIVRYINGCTSLLDVEKVEVFALDLSTGRITEINNIGGDCIFVDPCRCYSFPASSHQVVEGDLIYFVDKYKKNDTPYFVTTVYNMKDSTMKPFTAEPLSGNFDAPEDKLADPVWVFPSE
ncbi:unnamed protein product [Urochloa humidicola]